jgi:hypothetical protein
VTRRVEINVRCWECDAEVVCPKCQTTVQAGTPFGQWLRELTGPLSSSKISNQNLDYIWHNHADDWLITIEEKKNGGRCSEAQKDTHRVIYQLLMLASKLIETFKIKVRVGAYKSRWASVEYRGHYVVVFEKTTPDDSVWIKVNKGDAILRENAKDVILHLLTHGRLPESA